MRGLRSCGRPKVSSSVQMYCSYSPRRTTTRSLRSGSSYPAAASDAFPRSGKAERFWSHDGVSADMKGKVDVPNTLCHAFRNDQGSCRSMARKQRKVLGRYIVADPEICHGKPTFLGTRIMVAQILKQVA